VFFVSSWFVPIFAILIQGDPDILFSHARAIDFAPFVSVIVGSDDVNVDQRADGEIRSQEQRSQKFGKQRYQDMCAPL
jgi:hypothetical protein